MLAIFDGFTRLGHVRAFYQGRVRAFEGKAVITVFV